jgi:2-iminobutanoate/2-iminopropanoate deaminase
VARKTQLISGTIKGEKKEAGERWNRDMSGLSAYPGVDAAARGLELASRHDGAIIRRHLQDTPSPCLERVALRSPSMTHRSIHAANLPKPVGPYSPGMGFERLVFVSGQGATDPATGQLAGADTAAQTEQCLRNVRTILQAAGSDLQYVLRCGVFLLDMKEFEQMNGVYSRVFGSHRPARTTIQAAGLPSPGLRVEIDCIAYTP